MNTQDIKLGIKEYPETTWNLYIEMQKALDEFCTRYIDEFGAFNETFEYFTIENGKLIISSEIYYSGCGTECNSYSIPLIWLHEPDIIDRCREQIEDAVIKEEERKKALAAKREEEKRQAEYAKFLIYKEQFEPENK